MILFRFSLLILIHSVTISAKYNNVCKTYRDYNTKLFNKNCWYNPDADLSVPEIIRVHGYPLETHRVKTKDGYLLQMFRIPHGLNPDAATSRQPVFIQHGVLSSCSPFVTAGNASIAFRLANEGYDVWLGNSRGSTYGKGHVTLSTKDQRYWNFSFHEMGMFDIPASLDLVAEATGRKDIIIMTNSMGACLPLVYASKLPEHASQRLKFIFHIAPTVFVGDIKTKLRVITPYEKQIKKITDAIGMYELLPLTPQMKFLSKLICEGSAIQVRLCLKLVYFIFGPSTQFLPEYMPVLTGHFPAGTSTKTLIHLFQSHNTGKFRQFDYGRQLNKLYYDSYSPPDYDLTKVKVPNYIMYGTSDYVSTEKDSRELYTKLPNMFGMWRIEGFNHADFFFSKDVIPAVQDELFRVLNKFKN